MIFDIPDTHTYTSNPQYLNTTSDKTDIDRGDKRRRKIAPI